MAIVHSQSRRLYRPAMPRRHSRHSHAAFRCGCRQLNDVPVLVAIPAIFEMACRVAPDAGMPYITLTLRISSLAARCAFLLLRKSATAFPRLSLHAELSSLRRSYFSRCAKVLLYRNGPRDAGRRQAQSRRRSGEVFYPSRFIDMAYFIIWRRRESAPGHAFSAFSSLSRGLPLYFIMATICSRPATPTKSLLFQPFRYTPQMMFRAAQPI